MASGFTVATRFQATGNLGRELKSLKSEFGQVGRIAGRAKSAVIGFGTGLAVGGAAALAFGVREVAQEYVSLDQAITNAASKFGDGFDRGTQGFNDLMEAAKRVGLTTEHQAGVAADGLNFLAMAGFTAEESLALLPGVANLATAANLDFARSSDIASDALGAFGMAHGDASQKSSAFSKIMGQVAATVNKANTDISQWFEAVQSGAPAFTIAGQKMSSFNTAVALLANNGIKGEKAGTALRGVMANLSKTSGKQYTTLKKLGVSVKDSGGNFRDFADILGDLETKLAGMGTAERTGVLEKIFGKRQMGQMAILLGEGAARFREFRAEIEDSAGAEVELATKMRKSIGNTIKLVQSALVGKGINIIQELFGGDDPAEALTNLATAIQEFDTGPMVQSLREAGRWLKETGVWLRDNKEMIKGLGAAFLALKIGSWAGDIVNGAAAATGALGTFGKRTNTVGKSVSKSFGGMAASARSLMVIVQALLAAYQAVKFAADAIAARQEAELESRRQDARIKRGVRRADITQYSEKNLKRFLEIDKAELERRESRFEFGDKAAQEQADLRRRIQRFEGELERRRVEEQRGFDWNRGNWGFTPAVTTERALQDTERMRAERQAPVQRTETVERTESTARYEIDWGKPPPGVTVSEPLSAGGMP